MATLFFDHKQNLEPVLKLYLGNYPDTIGLFATKIVESLSVYMSTESILSDTAFASNLLGVVRQYYHSMYSLEKKTLVPSRELHMARVGLARKMLLNPAHS